MTDRFGLLEPPGLVFLRTGADPIFALCAALEEVGADPAKLAEAKRARVLMIGRQARLDFAFETAACPEALVEDFVAIETDSVDAQHVLRKALAGLAGRARISTHTVPPVGDVDLLWDVARHLVDWQAARADPVLRFCVPTDPVPVPAPTTAAPPPGCGGIPLDEPAIWRRDGRFAVAQRASGRCSCGNTHIDLGWRGYCPYCTFVMCADPVRAPLWERFAASEGFPRPE